MHYPRASRGESIVRAQSRRRLDFVVLVLSATDSYSYSMAVRTSAMPIFDRFGLCCCGPMRWIAILHDDEYEYEYRSSARADSLSTSTRKRTNKALDRSARSSVFGLRRVNSSHSVNANVLSLTTILHASKGYPMLKHSLLVVACCMAQITFADDNRLTSDENAKFNARIEQLEKRIEELERQNARQPSVTVVPQYHPYHAPQYLVPRSQPNTPNYPDYGPRPLYLPRTPLSVRYQPQNLQNDAVPGTWKPFDFNGVRYYIIPVDEAQRINRLNQNDRTTP